MIDNYAAFLLRELKVLHQQRAIVERRSQTDNITERDNWLRLKLQYDKEIAWRSGQLAEEILAGNLPNTQ